MNATESKDRQKAIREAALRFAELTGSVSSESLRFMGYGPEEVERMLRELYEAHDLERTTRGEDVRYHIPTQPR